MLCSCTSAGFWRGPRVAVGRQHGDRLLQRQDVLHLRVVRQRVEESLLDGAGVPEHVGHAVGEELLDDGEVTGLWAMVALFAFEHDVAK